MYKNREKRIFEFADRFDPPQCGVHIDPQNLKIPIIESKIKVVESGRYDLSKLVREGH